MSVFTVRERMQPSSRVAGRIPVFTLSNGGFTSAILSFAEEKGENAAATSVLQG